MKIGDKVKPSLPPINPAMYAGICVGVVDIGEQYSEMYKHYSNKVVIMWELSGVTVEIDGEQKPRQISKTFTFSTSKKGNLRKLLTTWNGVQYSDEQFRVLDLFAQIGKPCFINVVMSDDGKYSNVDTVTPLPVGYAVPTTTTAFVRWDMDAWDDAAFEELPEWAQERIKKSTQYQKAHPPKNAVDFPAQSAAQGVADRDMFFYHPESYTYWMIRKGEPLHGEIETSQEIEREVFAWGLQTQQEPHKFKELSRPAAPDAGIPASTVTAQSQADQADRQDSSPEDNDEDVPF